MTAKFVPPGTPRLSSSALRSMLAPYQIDRQKYPLIVVGIRGYYLNSLGKPGLNDRGIYDDAIFIDSPSATASFNGNTDPSGYRPGEGFGKNKGMARLNEGVWYAHCLELHQKRYLALCQRNGEVTVMRDGNPPYEHTGYFGINIHKGGYNTTSSLGCQTIYPRQWDSFIAMVQDQARRYTGKKWKTSTIPYVLIKNWGGNNG